MFACTVGPQASDLFSVQSDKMVVHRPTAVLQEKDQTMLQERYNWLVQQRNILQKQLAELDNGQADNDSH